MTELSTSLSEPQVQDYSTQLDDAPATTQATPHKPAEPKPSRMDALDKAFDEGAPAEPEGKDVKDADTAEAKPAKVEADAKPEAPAEKPDKAEAAAEKPAAQPERRARPHIEAPDKFLPRAKELWQNVPHEVRSEMQRVMAETEQEATAARESVKEWEAVRPFAEMAKAGGTTIDQALGKYIHMEQTLRSDPAQGLKALFGNMQIGPVQAIGHILTAYNVRPEQLAEHMMQAPNEYTALARPQQQAPQQQSDPRVEQLQEQIAMMQQLQQHSHIETTVIAPFAAENPRYHELEPAIAKFLKSDIIPQSLSLHDRLAAAYDMAVRISPAKNNAPAPIDQDEALSESRAGEDFGGNKSVRGAPATGMDTSSRRRSKMSRGDALTAAMADLGIAH